MQLSELLSTSEAYLSRVDRLKKADIVPLRELIREHNRLYHQEEAPIISDTEYDKLFHALARLEADHDMLDEGSPTAKLAILASEQFQKVAHRYPMISLDNTYNSGEVRDFEERMRRIIEKAGRSVKNLEYYIQPKYDGLGLALVYERGRLTQAITRGSGVEGEDVTLGAMEIAGIPKYIADIADIDRIEVRGEVMMSRTTFARVNAERLSAGEKLFANPRNAASGSLRQLDPLVTRSRQLQFFAYSIPEIEQYDFAIHGEHVDRYHEMMTLLTHWGFEREDFDFRQVDSIDALIARLEEETKDRKEYFDFDIDGMVIKLDDMTLWSILGRTEHHPRYSIAYKFPANQVRTRVLSIDHSVGRTGAVTPVANLEPVEVTGVMVKRATLHNYDELAKKDVRIGDQVFVMRAGEVIPDIVAVLTEVRDGSEVVVVPPTSCPICDTPLQQDAGMVAIYCPNPHCSAKVQGQLEMFVSKQGLNIDGLGEKQIALFLELGWITDFASIFHIADYRNQLATLDGYKEKSINNLLGAIEAARHTTLDRVLAGLGIPNVGKKTAKQLSAAIFAKMEREDVSVLDTLFSYREEELVEIPDVGPETARAFDTYMQENRASLDRLFAEIRITIPSATPRS